MTNISEHITFREAVHSDIAIKFGIENIPTCEQMTNIELTSERIFEPLRKGLGGHAIHISSFFRNLEVNTEAKGSKTSRHMTGQAMDLDADYYKVVTNEEIFNFIRDNLEFDKLIWEYEGAGGPAWVHVSYVPGKNRKLVYKASVASNGKTKYTLIR